MRDGFGYWDPGANEIGPLEPTTLTIVGVLRARDGALVPAGPVHLLFRLISDIQLVAGREGTGPEIHEDGTVHNHDGEYVDAPGPFGATDARLTMREIRIRPVDEDLTQQPDTPPGKLVKNQTIELTAPYQSGFSSASCPDAPFCANGASFDLQTGRMTARAHDDETRGPREQSRLFVSEIRDRVYVPFHARSVTIRATLDFHQANVLLEDPAGNGWATISTEFFAFNFACLNYCGASDSQVLLSTNDCTSCSLETSTRTLTNEMKHRDGIDMPPGNYEIGTWVRARARASEVDVQGIEVPVSGASATIDATLARLQIEIDPAPAP